MPLRKGGLLFLEIMFPICPRNHNSRLRELWFRLNARGRPRDVVKDLLQRLI
jgi:hypothetical protein